MKKMISKYISLTGEEEDKRLELQNRGLFYFDHDVYKRTFKQYPEPVILDIGCGTGRMIHTMLSDTQSYRLFGVDDVARQIELAQKTFPDGHFFNLDVESESFFGKLEEIMKDNEITGFDVVNCSMVILHLKDPVDILTRVRSILSDNGTLIIRDIDDGIHFAWPDDEDLFKHFYDICARDARLGDRHCGRKLYHYLKKAGFRRVCLEKEGLSTADMDDKMLLYEMFVPNTLHYMEQRYHESPENEQWKNDYFWFRDHIDKMKAAFEKEDFISSAGFISFTAKA